MGLLRHEYLALLTCVGYTKLEAVVNRQYRQVISRYFHRITFRIGKFITNPLEIMIA